ncbi:MAG TPA: lipocalin-like domain-containing protein [Armatimonadota bacterium]|nr:lipocalin-like domain-containing protein [Armatimonadota bacterium]
MGIRITSLLPECPALTVRPVALLIAAAEVLFAGAFTGCSRMTAPTRPGPTFGALAPIGSSSGGVSRPGKSRFALAMPGYRFQFPRDSGSHPKYETEWWYYTGHLKSGGRTYGFEITFFRVGLLPHAPRSASRWATSDLYFAHFAMTNVSAGSFHFTDRVDRGALGLSGADTARENVWIQDWHARAIPGRGDPALWPQEIQASAPFGAIRLSLIPLKPPVIQGRNGVSLKGPGAGEASHYYSYTRLAASGTMTENGQSLPANGLVWMDHEFSSSALAPNEEGWDWFSVQLDNGWDLMLYELRLRPTSKTNGSSAVTGAAVSDRGAGHSISPFSSGALVAPNGSSVFLRWSDFRLTPHGTWKSPRSGAIYPSNWEIHVPRAGLDLHETPALADQELDTGGATGVVYWEGAMRIRGTQRGRPVSGAGYTELTGYGGARHLTVL